MKMTSENPAMVEVVLLHASAIKKNIADLLFLMTQWCQLALIHGEPDQVYTINFQFMSPDDMQALNSQFRHKAKPTNVLSFPANDPFDARDPFIGDIAICTELLKQEAKDQHKTIKNHLAHLVIHSVLHCQGYDHQNAQDAQEMEAIEVALLEQCGMANPYLLLD